MIRKIDSAEQLVSVKIGEVVEFDGKFICPLPHTGEHNICPSCVLKGTKDCTWTICSDIRFLVDGNKHGVLFYEIVSVSATLVTTGLYLSAWNVKPVLIDDEYNIDLKCSTLTNADVKDVDWRFKK